MRNSRGDSPEFGRAIAGADFAVETSRTATSKPPELPEGTRIEETGKNLQEHRLTDGVTVVTGRDNKQWREIPRDFAQYQYSKAEKILVTIGGKELDLLQEMPPSDTEHYFTFQPQAKTIAAQRLRIIDGGREVEKPAILIVAGRNDARGKHGGAGTVFSWLHEWGHSVDRAGLSDQRYIGRRKQPSRQESAIAERRANAIALRFIRSLRDKHGVDTRPLETAYLKNAERDLGTYDAFATDFLTSHSSEARAEYRQEHQAALDTGIDVNDAKRIQALREELKKTK